MTNMSHVVNHVGFGTQLARRHRRKLEKVPEGYKKVAAMDGDTYSHEHLHKAWHHYIHVVPTRHMNEESQGYVMGTLLPIFKSFNSAFGKMMFHKDKYFDYNQMLSQSQVVEFEKEEVPTVTFAYDVSPVIVVVEERNMKFSELIVKLLALVGGTFTFFTMLQRGVSAAVGKKSR